MDSNNNIFKIMNKIKITSMNSQQVVVISKLEVFFDTIIFINSDFRLYNLAFLVNYPPTELSKLIKKVYGISFPDWMLLYRFNYLDEIIKMELNKNNKIKINEIIALAGFNSRSNFYFSCKKFRNAKPKEYYNL